MKGGGGGAKEEVIPLFLFLTRKTKPNPSYSLEPVGKGEKGKTRKKIDRKNGCILGFRSSISRRGVEMMRKDLPRLMDNALIVLQKSYLR